MRDEKTVDRVGAATVAFERALESLILEAFADGAAVEGTWRVEPGASAVPNWLIDIRRESAEVADD